MLENISHYGFDSEYLSLALNDLSTKYVDSGKLSGFSVLIARNREIAGMYHTGYSAMGDEKESAFLLKEDSIYRIYSMSKPITAFAMMRFVERGQINLDDKVKDYIPAFKDPQVWVSGDTREYTTRPSEKDITVFDLLTHQSGLTYDFLGEHPIDALYRRKQLTGGRACRPSVEEFVNEIAVMPILFTPGEKWNYSFSLDVVGRIMEVVSGKPLDKILHEEVFEPLNMKDTGFTLPADKADRMTHLYFKDHRKDPIRCIDRGRETTFLKPAEMLGGGGGLLSTLTDYYKFCHMLESNGTVNGSTLLSKQTLDIMRSNQLPGGATMKEKAACNFSESDMEGSGFGISWSIITDPTTEGNYSSRGTYSWGGLGNTYFFIDPIEKISVILMTQIVPYGIYPIRTELKEIVYKALK